MSHPTPTLRSTWLTFIAVFAMAVQFVVALAPLAEGRDGRSMSAHVESSGTRGHYTHDDATCASCQARSIHGTTRASRIRCRACGVNTPSSPTGRRRIRRRRSTHQPILERLPS